MAGGIGVGTESGICGMILAGWILLANCGIKK
jgi:hypothetical protein